MQEKTLALLDASGYLYRAFHAIRPLTAPDGRPTNATFGFATMLRKLLSQRKPDAVAVCFDRPEKTFRHEMDPEYKATRASMPGDLVPQVADVKALCRAMGLAVVEEPGFEADDLIGTLAEKGARAGLKVEVVSADKDLFQLVRGDQVAVWHPVHEKLLDAAGVAGLFGAPPERVIDVLGLMGDASDNIPGVKGIGEKGAKELVSTFGSLEQIYARIGELKGKRREALEAGHDDAFRSRELATVRRDAPVPGGESGESLLATFGLPAEDPGRLAAFYEELGFFRLKRELLDAAGLAPAATTVESPAEVESGDLPVWETSAAALDAFLARAVEAGLAGLHVECAPGRPFPPEPIALVAALPGGGCLAAPLAGDGAEAGRAFLARLFAQARVEVVAHESKRLHLAAAVLGMAPPRRVFDTMLAAYVDGPGLHAHDLAGDARALLGRDPATVPSPKDVAGSDAFETVAVLSTEAGRAYLAPRALLPARASRGPQRAARGAPRLAPRLRGDRDPARTRPGADGARGNRGRPVDALGPFRRPGVPARGAREGDPLGRGRDVQRRLPAAARADPLREAAVPRPEEDGEDEELRDGIGGPRGAGGPGRRAAPRPRPRVARALEAEGDLRRTPFRGTSRATGGYTRASTRRSRRRAGSPRTTRTSRTSP